MTSPTEASCQNRALSLLDLNRRVGSVLSAAPGLNNVWVAAETSDLRCSGPHCYLELIEKDADTGAPLARARATIWGSCFVRLNAAFREATGSPLASGIKVMVRVNVSYHPVYGLSLNITDINPEYTLGDLLRRRREMIARLESEGIINLNRELPWPEPVQRVAVISAAGAAGYGDFINQLYTNRHRLRFSTRLFTAALQGENTAPSIIAALEEIAAADEEFDCVVIIRGGGATGDLASFDNYELAANIAMFPLPVIIGIGHERDITLLDYVAKMRVKTPTAAAEWLIGHGAQALEAVRNLGDRILEAAASRLRSDHIRLANIAGQLPALATGAIARERLKVGPMAGKVLAEGVMAGLRRRADRLDAIGQMIEAISPQATLRRGFSITQVDGHALRSAADVASGTEITTILADGILKSTTI